MRNNLSQIKVYKNWKNYSNLKKGISQIMKNQNSRIEQKKEFSLLRNSYSDAEFSKFAEFCKTGIIQLRNFFFVNGKNKMQKIPKMEKNTAVPNTLYKKLLYLV